MAQLGATFVPAYAKINLTLEVLSKREDNYHNLASIMQTIALHDTLAIRTNEDGRLDFRCDLAELDTPANLVLRAAQLLRQETGNTACGAGIELHKETPTQAGLGGGSSDAAAVLTHLNELWGLHIPQPRLLELAAQLGSDVPFFLASGTALIEGRGEFVTPLPDAEPLWLVLVKPAIGIPTPLVFKNLAPAEYVTGAETARLVDAIRAGEPLLLDHLTNTLEPGVLRAFPEVAAARNILLEAGASVVRMSGSGPSLFAPFRQLYEANEVYQRISARQSEGQALVGTKVWLTHTVARQL